MKHLLRFECIGDGAPYNHTFLKLGLKGPPRYFVYRLAMGDRQLLRRPMEHIKDFTHANGAGTRGVYAEYILQDGEWYEVKQPKSWNKAESYYCTVRDGELVRLTRDEVIGCLESVHLG